MNKKYNTSSHVIKGLKYGAVGDAWGFEHEFKAFKKVIKENIFIPQNLIVSDDTQMAIALAEALESFDLEKVNQLDKIIEKTDRDDIEAVVVENTWAEIVKKFMLWAVSEDNYRAPGNTCMGSLAEMIDSKIPTEDKKNNSSIAKKAYFKMIMQEDMPSYNTVNKINVYPEEVSFLVSKYSIPSIGSGAAMRVLPIMSLPHKYRYLFAWIQAISTHNDGRAAFSAMTLVHAWETLENKGYYRIDDSLKFVQKAAQDPTGFIKEYVTTNDFIIDVLIEALPESLGFNTLEEFVLQINEMDNHGLTLELALTNAKKWNPSFVSVWNNQSVGIDKISYSDPSKFVGAAGWDSISAVAISLRVIEELYSKDNLENGIMDNENIADIYGLYSLRDSIATSGDSDTLACIVGHSIGYVESLNDRSINILDSLASQTEKKYLHKINVLDSNYNPSIDLLSTLSFEEKSIFGNFNDDSF